MCLDAYAKQGVRFLCVQRHQVARLYVVNAEWLTGGVLHDPDTSEGPVQYCINAVKAIGYDALPGKTGIFGLHRQAAACYAEMQACKMLLLRGPKCVYTAASCPVESLLPTCRGESVGSLHTPCKQAAGGLAV